MSDPVAASPDKPAPIGTVPPQEREPEIQRENMLLTLEDQLSGDTSLLFLEGPDGTGKTTLLRQFEHAHSDRTFGLFISSASRWSYDPSTSLAELCEKMQHVLGVEAADTTDERRFARLQRVAIRIARQRKERFFFVLDGIEEIPEGDRTTRNELFSLLPIGFDEFRFVVSGSPQIYPVPTSALRASKSLLLPSFTADEVQRYFAGTPLTDADLNEIRRVTKGFPGHLASIRRLLMSGVPSSTIVSQLDRSLAALFELEWKTLEDDSKVATLLAILSYEQRAYSVGQLAGISDLTEQDVRDVFGRIPFIEFDGSDLVRFVSDSFRRFAASRLAHLRASVTELFIKYWQQHSDEDEALVQLPNYFQSANRLLDLVSYLSPERFATLYKRSPSIALVQQKAAQGIEAARRLKRDADVIRFTLQQSTVIELAESDTTRSEVRALTALGSYEEAIAIAESEARLSERLRLLVAIARVRKEHSDAEDPTLLARIRDLYSRLDASELGENVGSIAMDLFYTFPDLAIELVSKAGRPSGGENSLDWVLVQLSVQAQLNDTDRTGQQRARDIRARIEDPVARKLSTEAMMILGRVSATESIVEAKKLEAAGDQLYVLQHWMQANPRSEDALDVLDEGLQIAVRATGYSANAGVYRALASCLPYVPDVQRLSYYVGRIDAQKANLERMGPREEFIQLQLMLARAEWRFDKELARKRYIDVYNNVSAIVDIPVRAAATARLIGALTRMDPERELESDGLHSFAETDLASAVTTLLADSAEQYEAIKGVIEALSRVRPDLIKEIIPKLNTEPRRDDAYAKFAREAVRSQPSADRSLILDITQRIHDDEIRDRVLVGVVRWLARRSSQLSDADCQHNLDLLRLIKRPSYRTSAAGTLLSQFSADPSTVRSVPPKYQVDLVAALKGAWSKLDADWLKLDVGYSVIADISVAGRELAGELASDIDSLKKQVALHTIESSRAAYLGLLLSIRCYGGMSARALANASDLDRLRIAIERLGSGAEQAELWAELALRQYLHGNLEACSKTVTDQLVPQLESIKSLDAVTHADLVVRTAAALYCGSRPEFDSIVLNLPEDQRESAVASAIWFLLKRIPATDSYRARPRSGYPIDYQTALSITQLIDHLEVDTNIYSAILALTDSAVSPAYKLNLKQAQRDDVALKLETIVTAKFPSPRFIRHNGYLIAARANIATLRKKSDKNQEEQLIAQARELPNAADRVYVLAILASTLRDSAKRHVILAEVADTIPQLPFLEDRIDRYEMAAGELTNVDEAATRRFLKAGLQLTFQSHTKSMEERRKSIIDRAYRIDPDFASSLASTTDDEPAKKRIEQEVTLFKLKDALGHKKLASDDPLPGDANDCSQAAWWQLGELNARRAQPIPVNRTLEYMQYAAVQPVGRAYPIFAWAIENAVRRAESDKAVRPLLVSLFEACLRGAELASYAAMRPGASRVTLSLHPPAVVPTPRGESILIKGGERELALARIKEWLIDAVPSELFIVDPYFTPEDVSILQLIQSVAEDCQIVVLTDKRNHDRKVKPPYEDAYRTEWVRLSSQDPPPVTIILATTARGKFPTHDRWWLTAGQGGVYMGTSMGGLGNRWSELRFDDSQASGRTLVELSPLFNQSKKAFEGERVYYSTIRL